MIPSKILVEILKVRATLGEWVIKGGMEPATPDRTITCIDSGGLPSNPKWLLDFPSVQVVVRGPVQEYEATYNMAVHVKDILLGIDAQDVAGGRLDSITLGSDIFYIGRDENQRHKFTINFDLITEPAANAHTNREAL